MPNFSANLGFLFTELPFLDRFAAAARAGFKGVEYASPYDHGVRDIARRLADHGLTQALVNLPAGDWEAGERGIAILPGREEEFRDGVSRALDYAGELGCVRLNCLAGIAPPGADQRALEETFVASLGFAAEATARRGVRLLIEPINTRDMPGFFLNRSDQALRLMGCVKSDNLYLQADISHAGDGGRSRAPSRSRGAGNRAYPDRRQSRSARAWLWRDQLCVPAAIDRPARLRRLGWLRIPASDDDRSRTRLDGALSGSGRQSRGPLFPRIKRRAMTRRPPGLSRSGACRPQRARR